MPQSRKRHAHSVHHNPSAIPSRQRTKGRNTWSILFAVFGLLIAFFAAGLNYIAIIAGAIAGAILGYIVGKNMEKQT